VLATGACVVVLFIMKIRHNNKDIAHNSDAKSVIPHLVERVDVPGREFQQQRVKGEEVVGPLVCE